MPALLKNVFGNMTLLPTWWPRGKSVASAEQSDIRLSLKQKIFFLDTIGSLVGAGIPIVKSLQLLYFQTKDQKIRDLCLFVKTRVEQWKSLAATSRELPKVFSSFDSAMFEMGDATGKIGQIFTNLTQKEEKTLDIERKVTGALIYPATIVTVAILMVVGLLLFVIPRIELIYQEAHTSLPTLTQSIINLSHFLKAYGIFILAGLGLIALGVKAGMRKEKFRFVVEKAILRIPIFGKLIQYRILAIFSDFLSLLLASGITIHRALEIVGEGMDNTVYRHHLVQIIQAIRSGKHLSGAIGGEYLEKRMSGEVMERTEIYESKARLEAFGVELTTSVKVGEQTGTLASMLAKSAERYTKEIDTTVKNLSSMLEPVVIIIVGAIVGVIVLAIMMPFFNMVKVIG